MKYEEYTFWLLLVFAISASAYAYWLRKRVNEIDSAFTEKLSVVETMTAFLDSTVPDLQGKLQAFEGYVKPFADAGYGDASPLVTFLKRLIPKPNPPLLESPQTKVTTTSAAPVAYRIGRA